MLAVHDQFTQQIRNRLKTISMGLGLVRLLQDARLTKEAGTTLSWLENGFPGLAEESDKARQKPRKAIERRLGGSLLARRERRLAGPKQLTLSSKVPCWACKE
jgi:hypothetical protein